VGHLRPLTSETWTKLYCHSLLHNLHTHFFVRVLYKLKVAGARYYSPLVENEQIVMIQVCLPQDYNLISSDTPQVQTRAHTQITPKKQIKWGDASNACMWLYKDFFIHSCRSDRICSVLASIHVKEWLPDCKLNAPKGFVQIR
jgi:hypothetical protein